MKILKLLFIFTLVSMLAVSCKESKKEETQDDSSTEMTEEGTDASADTDDAATYDAEESEGDAAATGAAAAGAAAAEGAAASEEGAEGEAEAVESIDAQSKELEPVVVPEGVIAEELADTPVIYPGCAASTTEEIRACTKESFIAYLKSEFNHDIAKEAGLKRGDYQIGVVLHVNKAGRVFSLRVTAPKKALETEMVRVINSTPKVTPATHKGEPVGVSAKFLVDFKVEKL
ncbi:hypothetical protein [Lutimonas zeaxanthinifaciens]|uniref:hypothetical protein n=1 Tax=Lutimonas zeaxanthinifaciens TaxID=3060215 RepID=UPI00265CE47E|nr:hypothetical protein [Lutimonas sp. YSD2104]WKK66548.1 hypothetical protein QZH61_02745 [Lutimonas sp. YSD2104]